MPAASSICGCEVGKEMGVNAMREDEVQAVLKALRRAGLDIVAIHQHMSGEKPRFLFLHYWGRGRVDALARGLKTALDAQKRP